MNIRFGSEVYTWFMKESGAFNANRLDHMIKIIAQAGFRGIQPIYYWMGDLADPARLAEHLRTSNLELCAMSFVLDWNHDGETEEELREANKCMDFMSHFPGALLCVVQMPRGRFDLEVRRNRLVGNLNALARRAADRGIVTTFHPNSPETSIARTSEDYAVLLNGLDSKVIGWTPDVGHIINGGMDPLETMKQYADLINHIHYKDWDGNPEFAVMGEGKVKFEEITCWLRDRGFDGWIVCEDEGLPAVDDPDGVTLKDGAYVRDRLVPLVAKGGVVPIVDANGIKLYYEERGEGDPLVMIMGITARGAVWEKHAAFWQQNFRCILPDNRGVGLSDKPAGPYTSAQMADDYAALMQELGIGRARVIGCSMGSIIAQQLALRHPKRVRSMVLMCTWARCDRYARDVFQHIVDIKSRLRPEEFATYIQLLIFAKPFWDNDAAYTEMRDGRTAPDPLPQPVHGLEGQAAACVSHDTLADLDRIEGPCLVIGGRSDIFTPAWMAEEVAGRIRGSELHLYEGAGHAFHWECIEDFNPRIRDWFLKH